MNQMREIQRINERELELGLTNTAGSWHYDYNKSAYIFFGNVDNRLTEGDIICVFSQFGEIVDLNLVRDQKTGKSRGFGFLCYEDKRSCILAIDNGNGAKLLGRTMRVDHAERYRRPKEHSYHAENDHEKIFEEPEKGDMTYEQRRKIIWDYEAYSH